MNENYAEIQELLRKRADFFARLKLLPYDSSPEIKERDKKRYLYVRKRIGGKLKSEYVGVFSDELYATLLRYAKEARDLKKQIRQTEKELLSLGYCEGELSAEVLLNLDFARVADMP